jgi:hypothetical protein
MSLYLPVAEMSANIPVPLVAGWAPGSLSAAVGEA